MVPPRHAAGFYAAYFAVLGVILPFLGPYLQRRGVGAVGVGLITAALGLAKLVYSPIVGAAVDRGRWIRGVLLVHGALAAVCSFAVLWLEGPLWLGLGFFAIGLGHGTVLPLVEATVLERLPSPGYGRLRLWGSVGFVVAAGLGSWVLGGDGMARFPLLLGWVLVLLTVACWPFERAARARPSESSGPIPGTVWGLLILLTLHQVSHGPYYAFFSIHLEAAGLSRTSISLLWSLGVVAELAAFFAGARLERWLGLRRLLGVALALTPLRWLLLALPPSPLTLITAQCGHAATFAVAHLAGVQIVQRAVPAGSARRVQALYSGMAFGLGMVAGSALAGAAYARWAGAGSWLAAAVLSAVIFLAYASFSRRLRS
jgi:MFS transporter, PPP family, 3-phenylpropionic acid transporter